MTQIFTAFVDESNCIGCGKCIRVCPTDAIVGAKHVLHTIIPQLCTSCEECVNACPTDCISLKTPHQPMTAEREQQLKMQKQHRLSATKPIAVKIENPVMVHTPSPNTQDLRKQQIADAIARVQARKNLANKPR